MNEKVRDGLILDTEEKHEVEIAVDNTDEMYLGLKHLEICFTCADAVKSKYIGVIIKGGDLNMPHINIIHTEDYEKQIEFYKSVFNQDLHNIYTPSLQVVGFTHGNTFDEIEHDLLGTGVKHES